MYFDLVGGFLFFFYKQKTAYELRISDWSSDVCSSDLLGDHRAVALVERDQIGGAGFEPPATERGVEGVRMVTDEADVVHVRRYDCARRAAQPRRRGRVLSLSHPVMRRREMLLQIGRAHV